MAGSRRVAVVTGARRGIGRGICYALASAGFDLAMIDVAEDAASHETLAGARERGANALFLRGDIAEIGGHAAALDVVYRTFGAVDCLVNNAGVSVAQRGDVLDVTPESFDRVVGINLRGTFFFTQATARRMIAEPRAVDAPPRAIITISSINVWVVGPDRAEYCIAKTGLTMMTKILAVRLAAHRICTYEIRPGIIATDMTAVAKQKYDRLIGEGLTPMARWGQPDDIGAAVAVLASGALPFATGDAYHIDGGMHIFKV
ncbi:MAG TPA: 3-ketoacyl-ACP reductase [Alphaproteobacteria bacterium]|nr:3-ketoacyl-ACP reductase [Alphaproteobacteria bacterium]